MQRINQGKAKWERVSMLIRNSSMLNSSHTSLCVYSHLTHKLNHSFFTIKTRKLSCYIQGVFNILAGLIGLGLLPLCVQASPSSLNHYLYRKAKVEQHIAQQAAQDTPLLRAISANQVAKYAPYIKGLEGKQQQRLPEHTHPIPHSIEFVSFSMPTSLLIAVLRDAKAHHTPVVLRGLIDNSFKKTAQTFFNLAKQNKGLGGIEINPLWYRTFHIKQVPAFVKVSKPSICTQNSCPSTAYFVVYGNVHISDALSQIQRAEQLHAMEQSHE